MNEPPEAAGPESPADDRAVHLLRDWTTIWASEVAAAATDRETHEMMQAFMGAWVTPPASRLVVVPNAPGPLIRRGPRPLLLHLTLAMLKSPASPNETSSSNVDWPNSPATQVLKAALAGAGANQSPTPESLRHNVALIAGIAAYRRHP